LNNKKVAKVAKNFRNLIPRHRTKSMAKSSVEKDRLARSGNNRSWKKWGPYVADRQWGTVREDYSENGDVWNFISHDLARSNAYRWGEEAIAGFCDYHQILCLA